MKPCLEAGNKFVLEEEDDSGHGTGQADPVRTWKQQNSLKNHFNCAMLLYLALIENCWAIPIAYVRKYPYWDDATLEELI